MAMKATRRRCPLSPLRDHAGIAATVSSWSDRARNNQDAWPRRGSQGVGAGNSWCMADRWGRKLMVYGRSLGLPPLGGIANYQEAARTGLSVEQNVRLLKRYAYVERRLMELSIAHLCAVPEWEVKCALALHCWLDAEHAT